jgi:c-di-GMP-related signal transduction protein
MTAFACPLVSPIDPQPSAAPARYLSRQPIVDFRRQLVGYQLLLGPGRSDDPEQATREMIDHWLMLLPEALARIAFVRCTRAALVEGLVNLLPSQSTVLGIAPGIVPDPELTARCQLLHSQGYRLGLDNFLPDDPRAPLLELVECVHFDFPTSDHAARQTIYRIARGRRFLAANVETEVHVRLLHSEGCSLFQGPFYAQPTLSHSAAVPKSYLIYLKLLSALDREPADLRTIEKLVSADASLCYRILRLANSAIQAHPGEISTVREALLMIGDDAVRRMATVAIAGALAGERSAAVLELALSRARFCELLAPALAEDPAPMYLLGMISTMESLLEAPLHTILASLPLRPEMKSALAGDGSPAAQSLDLVRGLEACDWIECQHLQHQLGIPENTIAAAHVDALRWSSSMLATLAAPRNAS